jgi:peroxiredoxin
MRSPHSTGTAGDDPSLPRPDLTEPGASLAAATAAAIRDAKRAGSFAPTFRLPDAHHQDVSLIDLIAAGPVVVSFYRGIWCSFCERALERLAAIDGDVHALGGQQVAIGPAPVDDAQRQRLLKLGLPVLADRDLKVAASYGLTVSIPAELREFYLQSGYVPPRKGGGDGWRIPIPATYLIGRTGRIILAAIDTDYRQRLQSADLLAALACLKAMR